MASEQPSTTEQSAAAARVRIHEYSVAAAVELPTQPCASFPASLHEAPGDSRAVALDISAELGVPYAATSPNLLAHFLALRAGPPLVTSARCTAQAFYALRGAGASTCAEHGELAWKQGDLFVLPGPFGPLAHRAAPDCGAEGAALYAICDEPLLRYLGVQACEPRFGAAFYSREVLLGAVEAVRHEPGAEHRNRMGILLGNKITEDNTKTLTHTLWSLLNMLPAGDAQRPHRHNSVALDLCVSAEPSGVYTLMGPELDEDGWVKDPVRCDWITGAVFTTPPGWWHSHHNETATPAWVLPMQDAGLYTYQRTLDIRFAPPLKKSASGVSMASAEMKKSY